MDQHTVVLDRDGLSAVIATLAGDGYRVIGPVVRDGAIALGELRSGDDLPAGWGVDVAPGKYRLRRREDEAVFGHSTGPQSWKQFLHPARRTLWKELEDGTLHAEADEDPPRYAFIGVRGCDLAAIRRLDRVLMSTAYPDGSYQRRRQSVFIVAVNCTEPGETCFCASMGTGPEAGPGYDLALTERIDESGHRFVVQVATLTGQWVINDVLHSNASDEEVAEAHAAVTEAANKMGRAMPDVDLRDLIRDSRQSPLWQEIAQRCMVCGSCTMVCPTCFCTTVEDATDLTGKRAERTQRWSSCFDIDFSYIHGGSLRSPPASRYRQWMSHKLGTWHDQFGESGCVGCGRCVAWCPAGIDITEEAARLAEGGARAAD